MIDTFAYNLLAIISVLTCSLTILIMQPPQHELSHSISIILVHKKTDFNQPLVIKLKWGRIDSNFYEYLSENKFDKNIQKLIRFTSLSGLIGNLIFTPFIFAVSRIPIFIFGYNVPKYNYFVLGCIVAWILFSISGVKNDYKNFKNPENFEYIRQM